MTSKFLAGPLVTAASSVSAIQKGLDISVVSNNAEIILATQLLLDVAGLLGTLDAITELDVSLEAPSKQPLKIFKGLRKAF